MSTRRHHHSVFVSQTMNLPDTITVQTCTCGAQRVLSDQPTTKWREPIARRQIVNPTVYYLEKSA